jgi:hypothetical protein
MKPQRTLVQMPTSENKARMAEINATVLAGRISYGTSMANGTPDQNLQVWKASGTTPATPNTNFTINHSLGFIPNTIVGQDTNNGGVLYRGTVAWSKTQVTLKCTTASAVFNVILA